jgi:hypothetical protein
LDRGRGRQNNQPQLDSVRFAVCARFPEYKTAGYRQAADRLGTVTAIHQPQRDSVRLIADSFVFDSISRNAIACGCLVMADSRFDEFILGFQYISNDRFKVIFVIDTFPISATSPYRAIAKFRRTICSQDSRAIGLEMISNFRAIATVSANDNVNVVRSSIDGPKVPALQIGASLNLLVDS